MSSRACMEPSGPMENMRPDAKAEASTEQFLMFGYKVIPCSKRYRHDWSVCPFAHNGEMAARRDPRLYQPMFCYHSKQRLPCPRGDFCPYAHNLFEYWLHPARYRTEMCQFGVSCTRPVCFFAHGDGQRRVTGIAGGPQPVVAPPEPLMLNDMAGAVGSSDPLLLTNIDKAALEQQQHQQQFLQLQHQHQQHAVQQHPQHPVHSDVLPMLRSPGLAPAPAAPARTAPLPTLWAATPAPAQPQVAHVDYLALQQHIRASGVNSAPLPNLQQVMQPAEAMSSSSSSDLLAHLHLLQQQQQQQAAHAQQMQQLSQQLASMGMGQRVSGGNASFSAPLPQLAPGTVAAPASSGYLAGLRTGRLAGGAMSPMDSTLLAAQQGREGLATLPETKPWSAPTSPVGDKRAELAGDLQSISFTSGVDSTASCATSTTCASSSRLSLQAMAAAVAAEQTGADNSGSLSGTLSGPMSVLGEPGIALQCSEAPCMSLSNLIMVGDVPLRPEQMKDQLGSPAVMHGAAVTAAKPSTAVKAPDAPLGVEAAAQLLGQLPEEHVRQLLNLVQSQHPRLSHQ